MKTLFTVYLLAATCAIAGGWSTNAWPAWQHPRAGFLQAQNCHSALVERAYALAATEPAAPTQYRSQYAYLVAFKQWLLSYAFNYDDGYCPFLDTTLADGNGCFEDYLGSDAFMDDWSGGNPFPFVDEISACQRAHLPTNYLRYTPWRDLSGLGAFTNDAAVGRPHGWTNYYTVVGGTNYPAGRSAWYTTDYGWSGIRSIVSQLVWTVHVPASGGLDPDELLDPEVRSTNGARLASCADARADCISEWGSSTWKTGTSDYVYYSWDEYDDWPSTRWTFHDARMRADGLVHATTRTNLSSSVDFYLQSALNVAGYQYFAWWDFIPYSDGCSYWPYVLDEIYHPITYTGSVGPSADPERICSFPLGDYSTSPTEIVPDPCTGDCGSGSGVTGIELWGVYHVYRWDVDGGLQYVD